MKKDIFEYKEYKSYLEAFIASQPRGGRGLRMAIANAIACPVSHISQVLNGSSHLSLEQAEGINEFFGHTQEQALFFFLLVQLARAGTPALKKRLQTQIQQVLEKRLVLKDRLDVKHTLSIEDQATFYSSWVYGAIHVMLTIDSLQTIEALSQRLGLSLKKVAEILEFLVSIGLAKPKGAGRYEIGTARIHLGADSPLISKFHSNWRMKSLQSLDKEQTSKDLHYSSVITVSEEDFLKIKSLLVKHIEEIKLIIKDSPAENAFCLSFDFFGV